MKFQFSFSIQDFQSLGIDQGSVSWAFAAAGNSYFAFKILQTHLRSYLLGHWPTVMKTPSYP